MSVPYRGGDRCPTCGKVRYLTRKHARLVARRMKHRSGKDGRLNAYQCGNFWHLGHLPAVVISGESSRDDIPRPASTPERSHTQ